MGNSGYAVPFVSLLESGAFLAAFGLVAITLAGRHLTRWMNTRFGERPEPGHNVQGQGAPLEGLEERKARVTNEFSELATRV
jgi:Na+/glutamate symporter